MLQQGYAIAAERETTHAAKYPGNDKALPRGSLAHDTTCVT
jgi:hypothetical protein